MDFPTEEIPKSETCLELDEETLVHDYCLKFIQKWVLSEHIHSDEHSR